MDKIEVDSSYENWIILKGIEMNIQELHEKKKAFETKLAEIIGKELSEFANEGVTITSIDVDFENVWPANSINPIKVLRQVKVCTSIWKIL